jgi:hypothetical protein
MEVEVEMKPELEEYLEKHPEFIQKWLQEKASPETVKEVLSCCSSAGESSSKSTPNNNNNNKSHYKNINSAVAAAAAAAAATSFAEDPDESSLIQRCRSRSKRNSITSDRFQSWLSSSSPKSRRGDRGLTNPPEPLTSRLESLDENALFIELVKDISNELDIDVLCHKILVNVGYLTHAERCNLYLARGPSEQRYLVAKLLDVTTESIGKF